MCGFSVLFKIGWWKDRFCGRSTSQEPPLPINRGRGGSVMFRKEIYFSVLAFARMAAMRPSTDAASIARRLPNPLSSPVLTGLSSWPSPESSALESSGLSPGSLSGVLSAENTLVNIRESLSTVALRTESSSFTCTSRLYTVSS